MKHSTFGQALQLNTTMRTKKEYWKISSKTIIDCQWEVQDLKASSHDYVGADNPDSFNQRPLVWEKEELNGLIQIKSVDFTDHYLGVVIEGNTCTAVLGTVYKNTWYTKIEDGTSGDFFITTTKKSPACYDAVESKYLTIGKPVKGAIPITFETKKPGTDRKKQKWKFTKVAAHSVFEDSSA